jgi:outer membrane protein OmpA-like peptidoglycan-associated protein
MRNLLLTLSFFCFVSGLFAQRIVKDHYTISGGLLGAMNIDEFRMDGDNLTEIDYQSKAGWSAGAWVNLPLGKVLSIDLQPMYNLYVYRSNVTTNILESGTIGYFSIPLLFKIHLGSKFALTVGPQFDFTSSVDDQSGNATSATTDDFASASTAVSAGFEIMPHDRITIFGRYVYGLTDMDGRTLTPDDGAEYFNQNVQIGAKLKLFGKHIDADSDGDGISDPTDACPNVFGLANYGGCPIPDTDGDGFNDEMDKCVTIPGLERYAGCPIPDTDKDGVNDEVDKCPAVAGLAKYAGCPIPDTDKDGINDEADKCPAVAGLAKYGGCPIPDTDGDGINDEVDKCPNQAGLAALGGCPDRDSDGVIDGEDRCPDVKGTADNGGCPKIENAKFNTQFIQFVSGNATLTAKSKDMIKEGAKLLNSEEFKRLKVEVRGHTDNTGKEQANMVLSQNRANAVMSELVKNGVASSRITAVGFGQTIPIADNKTAEGRAKNRRVAFDIRQ